jgi:hypothetical protein
MDRSGPRLPASTSASSSKRKAPSEEAGESQTAKHAKPEPDVAAPGQMQPLPAPKKSWFLAIKLPQDYVDSDFNTSRTQGHVQVVVPEEDHYFGLAFDLKNPRLDGGKQRFTIEDPKLMRKPDLALKGTLAPGAFEKMKDAENELDEISESTPYDRSGAKGWNCLSFAANILEAAHGFKMPKGFDYSVEPGEFYKGIQGVLKDSKVPFTQIDPKAAAKAWKDVQNWDGKTPDQRY